LAARGRRRGTQEGARRWGFRRAPWPLPCRCGRHRALRTNAGGAGGQLRGSVSCAFLQGAGASHAVAATAPSAGPPDR